MRGRARAAWLQVHLWLGLVAGAILVLLGITGSLLVFYPQMDALFDEPVVRVDASGERLPLGAVLAAAEASYPGLAQPTFVLLPETRDGAYVVRYDEPNPDGSLEPIWFAVNPYTGEALGQRVWGEFAMSWIYDLHFALRLGHFGEHVVGIVGMLTALSLLSGVVLWFPTLRAGARRALTMKWRATGRRFDLDLHNVTGIYSLVVLGVVALSGTVLIFQHEIEEALATVSAVTPYPQVASDPAHPQVAGLVDRAVDETARRFPGSETYFLALPAGPTGTLSVAVQHPGGLGVAPAISQAWFDRYSGELLAVRDWNRLTRMDHLLGAMLALHNGTALGLAGRWIVLASGLVPLLLYVTGVRLWWRRRARARRDDSRGPRQPLPTPGRAAASAA